MKITKWALAIFLAGIGFLWMFQSAGIILRVLALLGPGARNDFTPWFLLIYCVVWLGIGIRCFVAAASQMKGLLEKNK